MYGFFSPNLKNTLYSFPHIWAISLSNAPLIHRLYRRKRLLLKFALVQSLFKFFTRVQLKSCLCTLEFLLQTFLSLLIWVNSSAYCIEKRRTLYLIQSQATLISENYFPSFFHTSKYVCICWIKLLIFKSLNLYIFDKVTKKVRDDRKKLRDWHINEIWSRGVDFSYIPWNVLARILFKLKIHQNWDLSSCQMSEHVVTFLFYLFIYLFFTFTWLFSRYTVV